MRKLFVYRVEAWHPDQPDWEAWDILTHGEDRGHFKWPRRRNYLTEHTAASVAGFINQMGGKARVLKSDPITFPEMEAAKGDFDVLWEAQNTEVINGLRKLISSFASED